MELTQLEQEQIASLHGLPAFETLVRVFKTFEEGLQEQQLCARSDEELRHWGRLWQWASTVRRALAGYPENLSAELERLRDEIPMSVPPRGMLWVTRNNQSKLF